jgi:hypothetical protein
MGIDMPVAGGIYREPSGRLRYVVAVYPCSYSGHRVRWYACDHKGTRLKKGNCESSCAIAHWMSSGITPLVEEMLGSGI